VRDGGFLREVSWERALSEASAALGRSGERTVALVGGTATNEEGFLLQHLLREGLGSPHVTSRATAPLSGAHARTLARPDLSAKVSDIDYAGAILVLDTELVDEAPILDLRVRKAVRRNHARLVVASARPSTLDPNASASLRFAPGAAQAALTALAAALGSPRASGQDVAELARAGRASADAVRAAADVLRDAGDVVVIWGGRVASGPRGRDAVEALLAVAGALGIADREESGLIEVPAETNGRGLREVGCLPQLEPGLKDAGEAPELAAPGALLLLEDEPPEHELAAATSVIAFSQFRSEALEELADVVFPAEIYPEKEGTVTHPDGRLQRVRQALGHAGEVRAGWQVLGELCERAGAGIGALAAPLVTAALSDAVPFYAGITLDEIGGLGVRWQEREAASGLPAEEPSDAPLAPPPAASEGLHAASVKTLWHGPETEHSPSLRFLAPAQVVELSLEDAGRAGVHDGDEVVITTTTGVLSALAQVRTDVPTGSAFVLGVELPEGPVAVDPVPSPLAQVEA
jgi:NADH-quinone oxidoreductase subunit G